MADLMIHDKTAFTNLQTDERLKKLERPLKLAVLKKEHTKNIHKVTSWPSISSINAESSFLTSSSHISIIGSEVLASSNNLKNVLLGKVNIHNNKQGMITTSSVKEYNIKQDNHIDRSIMPPPMANTVRCISKNSQKRTCVLSDCEKAESTILSSIQSSTRDTLKNSTYISDNANINKKYLHSFVIPSPIINDPQKVDRVFSRWKVTLNDQQELIIKGTLECGKVARSKPVIRRYTATCVESKFKHKYSLQGNIIDERNELPDYIRGKFYNGFPDDWENVYQIWRTYVNQACPVTFRWPSTITDSDDDLRSELTDLTYIRNNRTIPTMNYNKTSSYKNEYIRPKNLNIKKSSKKIEKYHNYSTDNFQKINEKDYSSAKSFISDTEKNAIPIAQTKNVKLMGKEDIKIDPMCRLKRLNKLKDILQEDKLKIIIDNLADKNCSPNYISKIVEMFDCLDYAISYKTRSEHNECAPVVSKCEMASKSEAIPLQQIVVHDNHVNINNLENRTLETKSYVQSTDLGYGSIRNDSNPIQLSNSKISTQLKHSDKKDLDESESEIYAGIPKISIEQLLLKMNQTSGRIHKRKMRKKKIHQDIQTYRTTPQCNTEVEFESVYTTVPITNSKQNLLSNESCVSITEDEMVPVNTRICQKIITQEPQERIFSSNQRNNFNIYGENNPTTLVQKQKLPDSIRAQKVNVFIKEQEVPHKYENFANSQCIVNYSSSDVEVGNTNINKQKLEIQNKNIKIHAKSDQDIVINSESNNNPEKSRELRIGFIEHLQSEIPFKRAKPTIISSVPINLNLKISNTKSKSREPFNSKDMNIIEDEKNEDLIPRMKTVRKKSLLKKVKPTITNNNHKSGDIKQDYPKTNNGNNSDNTNSANSALQSMINPTTQQSKSDKPTDKNNPKLLTAWIPNVVHYTDSKSKLGLIFQGKLLNEVDYVVNRKFTTDIVLRRLSATLIETVNHEFYQLIGYLNDNKHILPKELAQQCRNGCPAKIEEFCLTWKKLQQNDIHIVEEKLNSSMDSLSVPVSSRGRKILPPLCYWTGERVTLKDNNPVYNSGNSQESSLTLFAENLNKKSEENQKQNKSKEQDTNKQKISSESSEALNKNQKDQFFNKSSKTTVVDKMENAKKSRKPTIIGKRQIAQQLMFLSSDPDEEEKVPSRKYARKPNIIAADTPSYCTMTLRKRQKVESSNRIPRSEVKKSKHDTVYCSPTKESNYKTTYTYYKNITLTEDLLSENPASPK